MGSIQYHIRENWVFCPLPWYSLTWQKNGNIGICCMHTLVEPWYELGNIKNTPMSELWNSPKIKELRIRMIEWKASDYCKWCYKKEENNVESMRQRYMKRLSQDIDTYIKYTDTHGYYTGPIKQLDLRLSNLCNLACRMCNGNSSTKRIPLDKKLGISQKREYTKEPYDTEIFWDDIKNWSSIEEIKFAGWEPLINPTFYKLMLLLQEKGISQNIHFTFLTNLTVLPENIQEIIQKSRAVDFNISIDGYGASYEYIRIGAKWEKLEENLHKLLELRNYYTWISIAFIPTIQRDNIYDFPKLYLFAKKQNIYINIKPLIAPEFLNIQNIDEEEKEKIELFYRVCIKRYSLLYPEIEKDFESIIYFMNRKISQEQHRNEYREKTKIIDDFAQNSFFNES